jgi:DNA-binding HxlR family transcriptional regulator
VKKSAKNRSKCPVNYSLEVFGDKWSLLIVRDVMLNDMRTYGDLLGMRENIATNILADRLVKLENAGILKKKDWPGHKAKFLYELTTMGIDLAPTLIEIIVWGGKHFTISSDAKALIKKISSDRKDFMERLTRKLKKKNLPEVS